MIFIAVGTQKFQFNRLLKAVDSCIAAGEISEDVFAQIGESDYTPKNYTYEKFIPKDEFVDKIKHCNLVITHGGVATIMQAIREGKPVVVVPRLCQYGEHVDDHQVEITKTFANSNYIIPCYEIRELSNSLKKAVEISTTHYVSHRKEFVDVIENFLMNSERGKK